MAIANQRPALEGWETFQRVSLIVGIAGLTLCLVGAWFSRQQFFQSYLFAYVFWLGIALGCLGIVMLHNLSGGAWGAIIRRPLESAMKTLPLMALLYVPLLFGLHSLYEWARPEALAHDASLRHKAAYLNVPFFVTRAAFYFALWSGAAFFLARWSDRGDRSDDSRLIARQRMASAPGLLLYGFTVTCASIDWTMSLEPHWYSTIYGVHFFGGHVLAGFAFTILVTVVLARQAHVAAIVTPSHFRDLGNLLLAFVMLWAYFAYSQWIIIWSGNLPEEISWYLSRNRGGWQWIVIALVICHFILPFLLLLSRKVKRPVPALAGVAGAIVIMRMIDIFWYTAPAFHPGRLTIHWMDIAAPVGLGGIWLAAFTWYLRHGPLQPRQDSHAPEVMNHG